MALQTHSTYVNLYTISRARLIKRPSVLFQRFDWPVARPLEEQETLVIELYSRNRLFADRLVGSYTLILQTVVRDGRISISDCLADSNHQPLPVSHIQIVQ